MDATSTSSSPVGIICRRYEVFYEYLRVIDRPLTQPEQNAFLYLLDMECSPDHPEWVHYEQPECICDEIMPHIVQALDPDPAEFKVAVRSLDGVINEHEPGHTRDLTRHFQGVVLRQRTKMEHADEIKREARHRFAEFMKLVKELRARSELLGYDDEEKMLADIFPELKKGVGKNGNGKHVGVKAPLEEWAERREHCSACGVSKKAARRRDGQAPGPRHICLINRVNEPGNLLFLCARCARLADGKGEPHMGIGVLLTIKVVRDPDEYDPGLLAVLFGQELPDLMPVPDAIEREFRRHHPSS